MCRTDYAYDIDLHYELPTRTSLLDAVSLRRAPALPEGSSGSGGGSISGVKHDAITN